MPNKQTRLAQPRIIYSYGPYDKIKGDTQAIRITEGCPHNCPYCYEPTEFQIFGIPEIKKNKVLIYDMNLLAKPQALSILRQLPDKVNNKVIEYELVCGIDYRFLTPEIANELKIKHFRKIRIAWDWWYKDQFGIKKAIDLLKRFGYKPNDIMIFMICNWKILYTECCDKLDLCKVWGVQVSDCYFDNQTFPNVQPIHWSYDKCRLFRSKVRKHNQLVNFKIDPEVKNAK